MMVLEQNKYLLPGTIALKRNGRIVWYGSIYAPWEDVNCDTAVVSTSDFYNITRQLFGEDTK